MTAFGSQMLNYVVTFRTIQERTVVKKRLSWLCALVLDCALGCAVHHLLKGVDTFNVVWPFMDLKIQQLDDLISWLTQNPAGLKLNEPLNLALANFFRYHIYLWHTFVQILRVEWLWSMLPWAFCAGISVAAALIADLISVFSLHIICFHVYASRLARLTFTCLGSFWRAFRGKKYNPLRDRVDTVNLDDRQLFLISILFIIVFFLTPTVVVYFGVFWMVRWGVRSIQLVAEHLAQLQKWIDYLITVVLEEKTQKIE